MTKERRDKLIVGGKAGMLNAREQDELACVPWKYTGIWPFVWSNHCTR